MYQINIFGKDGCAKCDSTKRKVTHFVGKWGLGEKTSITFHDVDTVDGMAEGAFNNINGVPTTILVAQGETLGRWNEAVPPSEELRKLMTASEG